MGSEVRDMRRLFGAVLVLAAAVTPAAAQDIFPYQVSERTLENGLNVVAIPFDSPGIVSFYVVIRTGSRDEVEAGHSGFAHFFEHMMFRGTKAYPAAEYNDVLKRMGADSNASTWDDKTVYYITGPASGFERIVEVEADRFQNLEYTEEAFRTEALAVLGEYNKSASSPFLPMQEKLRDLAFSKHTYEHTTIGFLDDIKAMPGYYQYSRKFFDRFYRPENAIVLVVGDVTPERVFSTVARHFGSWKKGYEPPAVATEPAQEASRTGHIDWPTPTRPYLMLGYHVPAFSTDSMDFPALDVIAQLLFSETAPLYQELVVEKQLADFVSGGAEDHRDPYLFTIVARVKSNEAVPRVRETIGAHIQRLQEQPVDARPLDRIKSHLRYRFALSLDTPDRVADTVSHYLALTGTAKTINRLYELYARVTPEDVQRVARKTFVDANETLVTLSHGGKPTAGPSGGVR
jgi:zinc protease